MDDPTSTVDAPSKPPMRFRRTRIAVSMLFVFLTVALGVMWVRSFNHRHNVFLRESTVNECGYLFSSVAGVLQIVSFPPTIVALPQELPPRGYPAIYFQACRARDSIVGFRWTRTPTEFVVAIPYTLLVTIAFVITVAPWFPYRFSLRTMLIATTLVAVMLGLGVWLAS